MHEKMIYSRPFLPIKEVKNEENEGRCRCRTKKRGGGDRRYWQPGLINFVPQKLETFSLSLETERENYGDMTGREERKGFFFVQNLGDFCGGLPICGSYRIGEVAYVFSPHWL
jgi:hypothetical protein